MVYKQPNFRLSLRFAAAILSVLVILTGCQPVTVKPVRICPGAESSFELLSLLRQRSQGAVPIKATGRCLAEFYVDGKVHRENFPIKLWLNPPYQIRLHGDVVFNPRGIDLGSNEEEFWLAMKPREIGNSYFWGRWSQLRGFGRLKLSPQVLLESLGIIGAETQENWSLSNEDGFDVLTEEDSEGGIIKKVHVYSCDRRVREIEYFDGGDRIAAVELNKYKEVVGNVLVPGVIKIVSFNSDGTEDSFTFTLGSVKFKEFTDGQKKIFFDRTEPRGFKNRFEIVNGEIIQHP